MPSNRIAHVASTLEVEAELPTEGLNLVVQYYQFVEGDAPLPMIEFLFGPSGAKESQYATHRKQMGLSHPGGKPSSGDADPVAVQKAHQLFGRLMRLCSELPLAEAFVIIRRDTGLRFRDLWVVLAEQAKSQAAKGRATIG